MTRCCDVDVIVFGHTSRSCPRTMTRVRVTPAAAAAWQRDPLRLEPLAAAEPEPPAPKAADPEPLSPEAKRRAWFLSGFLRAGS